MKLNDFKKIEQQINEGFWDSLIGDKAVASIKSPFTGATSQQQLTQDIFIKDFMGDAVSSLKTGVKSGLIDPTKTASVAKPVDPASVKPPSTTAAAKAQQYNKQKQSIRDVNQYIQSTAKAINVTNNREEKIALTKELVNYMADRKDTPEWNNAMGTVQQVIKKSNLDPESASSAMTKLKAGQVMAEAFKIYYINKLLEAVDLTWEDLGLVVLKEANSKKYIIAESKYVKLNNLFESILNEADTVGDYMQKWFAQYMTGVDYSEYANDVNQVIKNIEQSYPKIKPGLKKLAQMAYAISKGKSGRRSEPEAQPAQSEQPAQPTRRTKGSEMTKQITDELIKLKDTDPRAYKELLAKMSKVAPK